MNQEELELRLMELLDGMPWRIEQDFGGVRIFNGSKGSDYLIANGVTIRKRGEWKDNTFCSRCGYFAEDDEGHILMSFDEFCPFCGADLRGKNNE